MTEHGGPAFLPPPGYDEPVRIGRGGFSVVYRARQIALDRPVAIKVLLTDLSDPADARRFDIECRALGRLGAHPHIIDVHDAGISLDGRPYLVMRYYPGGTLADRLRRTGPLPVGDVVHIGEVLAEALQAAHDVEIIHRDMKPENVLVDERGEAILTDFGVAAVADALGRYTTSVAFSRSHVAPEVLERNDFGAPSDVFALGSTLYTLIEGRPPYQSSSDVQRALAIARDPVPPFTSTQVPAGLYEVLAAAMERDVARRIPSAGELAAELRSLGVATAPLPPVNRAARPPEEALGRPDPDCDVTVLRAENAVGTGPAESQEHSGTVSTADVPWAAAPAGGASSPSAGETAPAPGEQPAHRPGRRAVILGAAAAAAAAGGAVFWQVRDRSADPARTVSTVKAALPVPTATTAWGSNDNGELGGGDSLTHDVPVSGVGLTDVVELSAKDRWALARTSAGTVWGWGDNGERQLATGDQLVRSTPVQIPGITDAVQVSAGTGHALVLRRDGTVWGWGRNAEGQLGPSARGQDGRPHQLAGLRGVKAVAAGTVHSMALLTDGTVVAWGKNGAGELGVGDLKQRAGIVRVPGLSGVTAIAVGQRTNAALRTDGTVVSWGRNLIGARRRAALQPSPQVVPRIEAAVAMAIGGSHALVLVKGGTVMAWGANGDGQLGDRTTADKALPTALAFPRAITMLAAGYRHSMALDDAGRVWAWGWNQYGQVTGRPAAEQPIPLLVSGVPASRIVRAGLTFSLAAPRGAK